MPAVPAPSPGRLTVPRGARRAGLDSLCAGMEAAGLTVSRQGLAYVVSRSSDPPPLLVPLDWRLTAAGALGDSRASTRTVEASARAQGLRFTTRHQDTSGWYSSRRVGLAHTGFKTLVEDGLGQLRNALAGTRAAARQQAGDNGEVCQIIEHAPSTHAP